MCYKVEFHQSINLPDFTHTTRTLNNVIVTTFSKIKLMQIVKLIASDFPVVRINEVQM